MENRTTGPKRLLVVDDDERFLAALARLLRGQGFEVVTATSSSSAIEELEAGPFAGVISDYVMPDGTGVELLRVISERWPNTARLLVSGMFDGEVLRRLVERVGADATASKPVSSETLHEALGRAFARAAVRRESPAETRTHVTPPPPAPRPRSPPSPRVLVVEPDPRAREDLVGTISAWYEVATAVDGASALSMLTAEPFDLALIEADLPDAAGVDVVSTIKEVYADMELVLTTARPTLDAAVSALRAGAADFVVKPVSAVDLDACLARLVRQQEERLSLALREASDAVFTTQDRKALPSQVVAMATRILGADEASLMLPDGAGNLLVAFSSNAGGEETTSAHEASLESCVAGRVAVWGRPVLLEGALRDDPRFTGLSSCSRVASSIVYPLYANGQLLGVLSFNRLRGRPPFIERDLERAGPLAAQVALALENSLLLRGMVAAEKLASIGQLAASIVHEINNPLTYVISNLDFAVGVCGDLWPATGAATPAAPASPDELQKALAEAQAGARRIQAIVKDMRVISRVDGTSSSRFDVNDAIRSAVRIAGSRLAQTTKLLLRLDAGLAVRGNAGHLSQVVINLLVNAEDAMTEAGCERREIVVSSARESHDVVIRVSDTGPGIPANVRAHVFQPFFTTKPPGKGTGLGLSISREIVARHGGRLTLRSVPGGGAEFTISLPAVDGTDAAEPSAAPAPEAPGRAAAAGPVV